MRYGQKEDFMQAGNGQCLVIYGHHSGERRPSVARWGDTGHEATFFRGSDATVRHFEHTSS
jgi:hypothetical protein